MLKDFKAFILRGNVVDLAVGVVIGAAFGAIINSIVTGFITPLISFITPGGEFAEKGFCVGSAVIVDPRTQIKTCAHLFKYGAVITSILSFLAIAVVIFFGVVKPVNKLMARFKGDEVATDRQCPECLSKIPLAAIRCAFCTAKIGAAK